MTASHSSAAPLEAFVEACRARIAAQLRVREAFFSLAFGSAGLCGLLVLGTRYFPAPMAALAICLGAWAGWQRLRHSRPDAYRVAQRADSRAGLSDALATAYHFLGRRARERTSVIRAQRDAAISAIGDARPDRLFPPVPQPTRRAAAALATAALTLVAVRVAVQDRVSFEPPLATILLSAIFGEVPGPPPRPSAHSAGLEDPGHDDPARDEESEFSRDRAGPGEELASLPEEESSEPPAGPAEMPEAEGLMPVPFDEEPGAPPGEDAQFSAGQDGAAGEEPAAAPPPEGDAWDEQAQSLFDKLQQAFENMLQTLDMASVDSSKADASGDPGGESSDQASAESGQGEPRASELDPAGQAADASMEGGEPGTEAGESASAGGQDSDAESSGGEDASAAGTGDGDKDFAEARQLEVIGALEELYMERAEQIKGEVTVETRLAEQSASVPYGQPGEGVARRGAGAVSRDEVPAAYRTYVRNYFEALRRDSR